MKCHCALDTGTNTRARWDWVGKSCQKHSWSRLLKHPHDYHRTPASVRSKLTEKNNTLKVGLKCKQVI